MKPGLLFITAILLAFSFYSCQTEIMESPPEAPPTDSTTAKRLIKMVEFAPASNDSSITNFSWDAANRVTEITVSGTLNLLDTELDIKFNRLGDGKINSVFIRSNSPGNLVDSVVGKVNYVQATKRLLNLKFITYHAFGNTFDSATFTYNAAGQVVLKESFQKDTVAYHRTFKQEFFYDVNGNMVQYKEYLHDGQNYNLNFVTNYTYGTHKTSLKFEEESFIIMGPHTLSPNNLIKDETVYVQGATLSWIVSDFLFNDSDQPTYEKQIQLPTPPGFTILRTYFYQ